jgi:tetratricopeptide (TPR) repeat protein
VAPAAEVPASDEPVVPFLPPGVVLPTVPAAAYSGQLSVEVRSEGPLFDFCTGARVLSLPSLRLLAPPRRWKLPAAVFNTPDAAFVAPSIVAGSEQPPSPTSRAATPAAGAKPAAGKKDAGAAPTGPETLTYADIAAQVATEPADGSEGSNTARYMLSLPLPAPDLPGEAPPTRTLHLAAGVLRFGPLQAGASAAAGEARPDFFVEWPPVSVFASRGTLSLLQSQLIQRGRALCCTLRRFATEPIDDVSIDAVGFLAAAGAAAVPAVAPLSYPVDPAFGRVYVDGQRRIASEDFEYRAAVSVALDGLLQVGAQRVEAEVNVEPLHVESEDQAAQEALAGVRDAAWSDYSAARAKAGAIAAASTIGSGKPGAGGKAAAGVKAAKKAPAAAGGAKGDKKGAAAPDAPATPNGDMPPPLHPYVAANTVCSMMLSLDRPLNPRPDTPVVPLPLASNVVPPRGPALRAPVGLDASQEFRRECSNAVAAIAVEYRNTLQRLRRVVDAGGYVSEDDRRRELLNAVRASGLYERQKDALKRCAFRIIRERFALVPGVRDSSGQSGRDTLASHLYAYMVGQMHAAVNAVLKEADSLAQSTTLPGDASNSLSALADNAAREPPLLRLFRVASECEFAGYWGRAATLHQTRITVAEERAAQGQSSGRYEPSVWHDYGAFCLRRGRAHWPKAVACLREAVSIDAEFVPSLLLLACLQLARGQAADAFVFSHSATVAVQQNSGDRSRVAVAPLAFGIHAFVAQYTNDAQSNEPTVTRGKALEALRTLLIETCGLNPADADHACGDGALYLIVSRYLLDAGLERLARKGLEIASNAFVDSDCPRAQRVDLSVLRARQFLQTLRVHVERDLSLSAGEENGPDAKSANLSQLLSLTGIDEVVQFSATKQAYDGAITSVPACLDALDAAIEQDPHNWEAWAMKGAAYLGGVSETQDEFLGDIFALQGYPDIADLSLTEVERGVYGLEMAAGHFAQMHGDSMGRKQMSMICSSLYGVGGGQLASDPFVLTRLLMRIAHCHQHLASAHDAHGGREHQAQHRKHLESATQFYTKAALESNAPSVFDGKEPSVAFPAYVGEKPWSPALMGVGRTLWALGDSTGAESAFSESNTLDNQNPLSWAWLALVMLSSTPLRDREAAACLDQASRLALVGDTTESTIVLHEISEQYRGLGHIQMAASLLRKVAVNASASMASSFSHRDAAMQAQLAWADALLELNQREEARVLLQRLVTDPRFAARFPETAVLPGRGSTLAVASMNASRRKAEERLAHL